jgi:hypothetical protein
MLHHRGHEVIWECEVLFFSRLVIHTLLCYVMTLLSPVKANSYIPCCSPAMPRICCSESELSRIRHSAAWERHGMCELTSAVLRRHVCDLPAFGEWWGHGRVAAGNGMGTAWYVWIQLMWVRTVRSLFAFHTYVTYTLKIETVQTYRTGNCHKVGDSNTNENLKNNIC